MRKCKLYRTWVNIRNRCNNPNASDYKYYGGKGIKVCKEWDTFNAFEKWAKNNGQDDSLTIDRIDSNGDYCPENCQWISLAENILCKRSITVFSIKYQCSWLRN